jgi:ribosomal protein L11 methyltransferase
VFVIVAASPETAEAARSALRRAGSAETWGKTAGERRLVLVGGPFGDGEVAGVVARLRAVGWSATDRPEGGGHLAAWQAHNRPLVIGDRLWVGFPWCEEPRPARYIEIDPGPAWGSGPHPTTRLLLEELATRLRPGQSVLDVGCGSGVLAIAAARLGAGRVVGVDVVPAALEMTATNAALNGVEVEASVAWPDQPFDVVLANIEAQTLRLLGRDLMGRLAPGGWLGLSGISRAQVSRVVAALPGATLERSRELDDWVALTISRG